MSFTVGERVILIKPNVFVNLPVGRLGTVSSPLPNHTLINTIETLVKFDNFLFDLIIQNYKGLNYQEDFCDGCGASKNRRGIFE